MKKKKAISLINISREILYLLKYASKGRIIFTIFCSLLNGLSASFITLYYKMLLDAFLKEQSLYFTINAITLCLSIQLISIICNLFFVEYKFPVWDRVITTNISKELYSKYLTINVSDINNTDFFDRYIKALEDADNRIPQILSTFQAFLTNVFSSIGIITVLISINPILIVFSLTPVFISYIANLNIVKKRYKYEMSSIKATRKYDYIKRIFTIPEYRYEIRTENCTPMLIKKHFNAYGEHKQIIDDYIPSIIKVSTIGANLFSLINYGATIIFLGVLFYSKSISIGDFSTLLVATVNLSSFLFYFFTLFPQMYQHSLFIENIRKIVDYKPDIESDEGKCDVRNASSHSIKINNISFQYSKDSLPVISNLSLTVKNGEKVVIVGKNGAGKSTLIKLLMKFYRPQSGNIYIDDINYDDVKTSSLRDSISYVNQEYHCFAFTIGENIVLHDADEITADEKNDVIDALRKSDLLEKIKKLPKGINTSLTNEFDDDGTNLSGGENQKLSIARAIYKKRGLIIMDEPSSNLDPTSEYNVFTNLINTCKGSTLILITHKLYYTKMFDRILYMEDGQIVESGSHSELMKTNGRYAKMFRTQIQQDGYNDEVTHENNVEYN